VVEHDAKAILCSPAGDRGEGGHAGKVRQHSLVAANTTWLPKPPTANRVRITGASGAGLADARLDGSRLQRYATRRRENNNRWRQRP
jgi:hypothetical protein